MSDEPSNIIEGSIDDLTSMRKNPRKRNKRTAELLEKSIGDYGLARGIVATKGMQVIAGNQTLQTARELGYKKIIIVPTTGDTLVVTQRMDIEDEADPQAAGIALADNRAGDESKEYNLDVLAELPQELLQDYFSTAQLDEYFPPAADETAPAPMFSGELDLMDMDSVRVPNALFASNNDFDIPTLDPELYPRHLELPVMPYGAYKRNTRFSATLCFYTEDYRFEALWKSPQNLLSVGPHAVIEPNFSCYPQTPRALVLWQIYRKRWMARYWQSMGIPVIADLNVAPEWYEDNALGIPPGFGAFATRGYSDKLEFIDIEYEQAKRICGQDPTIFLVYGGGKAVKAHCQAKGYMWTPEEMDRKRDKR